MNCVMYKYVSVYVHLRVMMMASDTAHGISRPQDRDLRLDSHPATNKTDVSQPIQLYMKCEGTPPLL